MKRFLNPALAPGDYTALLRPETVERWQAIAARERRRKGDPAARFANGFPPHVQEISDKFIVRLKIEKRDVFGRVSPSIPAAYRSFVERHPQHVAELEVRLAQRGFDLGKLMEGD